MTFRELSEESHEARPKVAGDLLEFLGSISPLKREF